jgi:hypothetical protein
VISLYIVMMTKTLNISRLKSLCLVFNITIFGLIGAQQPDSLVPTNHFDAQMCLVADAGEPLTCRISLPHVCVLLSIQISSEG